MSTKKDKNTKNSTEEQFNAAANNAGKFIPHPTAFDVLFARAEKDDDPTSELNRSVEYLLQFSRNGIKINNSAKGNKKEQKPSKNNKQ